ncbi:homing endonuclease associated repeat-containing protein [Halorubrum sp. JWXQ-INN 858]|uniref:homing endonuclease associated repeat-containing protein n=1 Tax=Halorubrum sp. JWXQ-INN 858 TaxID=2690782 RepID=UPI00374421FF
MPDSENFNRATISKKFGSWNAALEYAGYEPNKERGVSEEKLIKELARLRDELGRPPTESRI